MKKDGVNYSKPTIAELFSKPNGEKFVIPKYQRGYAWDTTNIKKFLDDINKNPPSEDYLLGTIVFSKNPESKEMSIIDGQQRVTSINLLFIALYLFLREKGEDSYANQIKGYYVKGQFSQCYNLLTLGKYNQTFFEKLLSLNSITELKSLNILSQNSSSLNLYENLKFFVEYIEQELDHTDKNILKNNIENFFNKVTSSIFFIEITVPTYSEASIIFETLNNRGEELTQVDLIKNLLFQIAENQSVIEDVEKNWDEMVDLLGLDMLELFFRYYTLGVSDKGGIYDRVESLIKVGSVGAKTFSGEILKFSRNYAKIISTDDLTDPTEINLIKELAIYGVTQCHSALMFGKQYLNQDDYMTLLNAIISLTLKAQIVYGSNPNILESLYTDLSRYLHQNKGSSNIGHLIEKINDKIPEEEEFKDKFKKKEFKRNSLVVKVILARIENNHNPNSIKIVNLENAHLEHIMPKSIIQWKRDYASNPAYTNLDEDHKNYLHTFGNFTLLRDSINKSIQNKNFEHKKSIAFMTSDLSINSSLKTTTEWTSVQILDRATDLAEDAWNIWNT